MLIKVGVRSYFGRTVFRHAQLKDKKIAIRNKLFEKQSFIHLAKKLQDIRNVFITLAITTSLLLKGLTFYDSFHYHLGDCAYQPADSEAAEETKYMFLVQSKNSLKYYLHNFQQA